MFKLFAFAAVAQATVFFEDDLSNGLGKWTQSTAKGEEAGKIEVASRKYGDAKGIKTTEDARFYQVAAKFDAFSNKGKPLFIQYSVANEQNIDCGGAYVKLLPESAVEDLTDFNGDTEYLTMFGPDICGSTKRTHFIFNYKDTNNLIKKDIPTESDEAAHLYQLRINPDNTFAVAIDGEEKKSGSLTDSDLFDMIPPKRIPDPSQSKPEDWDDREYIDDPEDVKPADWDDTPAQISDPDAEKPDDWDDELDGEWEAPLIDNPEYKGEWRPKQIKNEAYKGAWKADEIDNPDYFEDDALHAFEGRKFAGIGIEVWQVKSGTVFSDFLITDDEAKADAHLESFKAAADAEKVKRDAAKEEERKRAEEERKKAEAEMEEEDEEEFDEDEEYGDEKEEL